MSRVFFEGLAESWEAGGRPDELLVSHKWGLLSLMSWTHSEGAREEGYSTLLEAFEEASVTAQEAKSPDWYDKLLSERHYCAKCDERYRMENLAMCVKCQTLYRRNQ